MKRGMDAATRCRRAIGQIGCYALTASILCLGAPSAFAQNSYHNPILDEPLADPSVLNDDGQLYIYGTGKGQDGGFIPMTKLGNPADFNSWNRTKGVLQLPQWSDRDAWAPHVVKNPDQSDPTRKYLMFLTVGGKRDKQNNPDNDVVVDGRHYTIQGNCMIVAYSDKPDGLFTAQERPLDLSICNTGSGPSGSGMIDPFFYVDNMSSKGDGSIWLYWGSYHKPLRRQRVVVENGVFKLAESPQFLKNYDYDSTTSPKAVVDMKGTDPDDGKIQHTDMLEGSWIFWRTPYYYLMTSGYQCCDPTPRDPANGLGTPRGYAVVVWRTSSLKNNSPWERMPESLGQDGTVLRSSLRTNAAWESPGHNSMFIDGNQKWWIVYHARRPGGPNPRVLMMDKLLWKDYWPYLVNDHPDDPGTPSEGTMTGPALPLPQN